MRRATVAAIVMGLTLAACGSSKVGGSGAPGAFSTMAALPLTTTSPSPGAAPASLIAVELGETDATHMFIKLSSATAAAGKVTFVVANQGTHTHEFVVLQTDTPAAEFPIASFEGETDRIDEDAAGTNVGETGDMKPGETKPLVIDNLQPGHYAVVCNLPGHYRMGMHEDMTAAGSTPATASDQAAVTLGEDDPTHMFIKLSEAAAPAGKVTFTVTNQGNHTHEFVVLQTNTPAANFPIKSFEGETDRIDEDTAGKNVGETGDMKPGESKKLVIDLPAGHFALVCNLPGHYRMGMHEDFTVLPPQPIAPLSVTLAETDPMHMFVKLSANTVTAGKVTFSVDNPGARTHEFVVLKTDTQAGAFPVKSFEGETDRIDEDAAGKNVGETGDMKPGERKDLVIDLKPGHYAVLCNLPGHYRMGMHQDFWVLPAGATVVSVALGETDPTHMFIKMSATSAAAGTVAFEVTNQGNHTHEFVVLQTDTPAANFPVTSFEGETDRFDEDAAGTNVGETGDMEVGGAKLLIVKDMAAGHYAVACNLPGHYRMGMHQDFTVA